MKFILGTKKNSTQTFADSGEALMGTVIAAGPVVVTQLKTEATDGYEATQVGYQPLKPKRVKKTNKTKAYHYLREYRGPAESQVGDEIKATIFAVGDKVVVSAISKGKGFQGVVKRHGFHGGARSHGQKHSEREPGSIGATAPQRVLKGTRMGGRMGAERVTVKNLKVLAVDGDKNELIISGAVPGRRGTLVEITSS